MPNICSTALISSRRDDAVGFADGTHDREGRLDQLRLRQLKVADDGTRDPLTDKPACRTADKRAGRIHRKGHRSGRQQGSVNMRLG